MKCYQAFGRRVLSDRDLSFSLCAQKEHTTQDLTIQQESVSSFVRDPTRMLHALADFPGGPTLKIWETQDGFAILYAGWVIVAKPHEGRVSYTQEGDTSPSLSWAQVVERVVLPLWFLLGDVETFALHGGCVQYRGRAFLTMGASGAGKSTTVHKLLEKGALLLADDMVIIETKTRKVLPCAPSVRLWDRGDTETFGVVAREAILGLDDKYWYRLDDSLCAQEPAELSGVVLLIREADAPMQGELVRIEGMEAFLTLLYQAFDFEKPSQDWASRRLRHAKTLSQNVPCWCLRYSHQHTVPRDPPHIETLLALWEELV